eukprot:Pgem_evm1s20306
MPTIPTINEDYLVLAPVCEGSLHVFSIEEKDGEDKVVLNYDYVYDKVNNFSAHGFASTEEFFVGSTIEIYQQSKRKAKGTLTTQSEETWEDQIGRLFAEKEEQARQRRNHVEGYHTIEKSFYKSIFNNIQEVDGVTVAQSLDVSAELKSSSK